MNILQQQQDHIARIFEGKDNKNNICPVKDIIAAFSDKWSIYALLLLGQYEKMRFNEMRGEIKGISQRMLTVTLRSLEQYGLISRSIYNEIPPRVEYELTNLGVSLLQQLLNLACWAEENSNLLITARDNYNRNGD